MARVSPLNFSAFQRELAVHPDRTSAEFVLDGIRFGFRTGFVPGLVPLISSRRNMKSASEHATVIDNYLGTEVASYRVAGPFPSPPFPRLQCSRFGVIPKKLQPGKWRLILDLSSPEDHSVNAGIPREPFSIRYISVDVAIKVLMELGPGTLMAKFDVLAAYRNIPIHPDDRHLLGMFWRDNFYVDLTLPFGLRSALFILLHPWLNGFYEPTAIFGSYSTTLTTSLPWHRRTPPNAPPTSRLPGRFSISLVCPFIQVSVKDPLPHWCS